MAHQFLPSASVPQYEPPPPYSRPVVVVVVDDVVVDDEVDVARPGRLVDEVVARGDWVVDDDDEDDDADGAGVVVVLLSAVRGPGEPVETQADAANSALKVAAVNTGFRLVRRNRCMSKSVPCPSKPTATGGAPEAKWDTAAPWGRQGGWWAAS